MHASREKEGASSPAPGTFYSPLQMKNYLQDLRTNRPARPSGSRPPPAHFNTWSSRTSTRTSDTISSLQRTFTDPATEAEEQPSTDSAARSHSRRTSNMSIDEIMNGVSGRPLVQPPRGPEASSTNTERSSTPSLQYRESGRRQAEQDEARAVRLAMEELDLAQEEKLFEAARDEAAELVWKHVNPGAAEKDASKPYAYPGLSKRDKHSRSRSVDRSDQDLQRSNSKLRKRHSMGSSASGSRSSSLESNGNNSAESSGPTVAELVTTNTRHNKTGSTDGKISALAKAVNDLPDHKQRRTVSGSRRTASGSLFKNPSDQIYEEPEEETPAVPATEPTPSDAIKSAKLPLGMRRNPFLRFQSVKGQTITRSNTDPVLTTKRFDRYEIQNNPPSQSRNAAYTLNTAAVDSAANKQNAENEPDLKMKDGKEVRNDEIRAATGFRLKDRSAKLPTPTAVSDVPGRPIVSFQKDWNVTELKEDVYAETKVTPRAQTEMDPKPLSKAATVPLVPTMKSLRDSPRPDPRVFAPSVPVTDIKPSPPAAEVKQTESLKNNLYGQYGQPTIKTDRPSNSISKTDTIRQRFEPGVPTINAPQATKSQSFSAAKSPLPQISVNNDPSSSARDHIRRNYDAKPPTIGAMPPIPSISVSESPAPKRAPRPDVPSTSVSSDIPIISVSESAAPRRQPKSDTPSISVTPGIPSICVDESPVIPRCSSRNTPSSSVTPTVPTINVNGSNDFGPAASTRPLPDPRHHRSRPHGQNTASNPRTHWTPTTVRMGALCSHCALPIAGRIVSAGGSRFHPECFTCYQCGEHLECVAFYPEPTNKHAERVERIRARLTGQDIAIPPSHPTMEDMQRLEHEDGTDEACRFYCHLDFHELFSPRCKSCKTPIEGEVIVACGAEWHAGHFFCAQCGDPFDSTTPFVEKEGYAWCVNCHTNRFSTKCKKCRKPVTDMVVKALGAEWHSGCFVCIECSGPFEDGRYFLRGESQDPVCVKCEEKRLKA